ncbi:DUF3857 domain-containing protein [Algoriphagus sp. CAU 1675]|uniref:DUF3857 domain-containing protein n=1 Tax=Algoriphagus sp. CAU 1675 TaxID=3032597 RepID=UPI0023DAA7D8|nr:DUF3857 domain-containing protein [Algoriphagus sp. CAU 1675]MDF2156541.1 DUF3857 domain-containing protein [Algoriphagus sp. CAU 1675]
MFLSSLALLFSTILLSAKDSLPVHSKLSEKQQIIIDDSYEYTHRQELELTILTADGLAHAYTSLSYDKLTQITDFQLEAIDLLTGKTIEKAKIRDMVDAALYSNTSVYDDNRRKYYGIRTGKFPLKVKIVTETKSKTNFFLPTWLPTRRFFQKVDESTLEVIYPEKLGIRYKELNLSTNRQEETLEEGLIKLTWTEKSLPTLGPDYKKEDLKYLLLAPIHFALEDYIGKMDDWSGLASWQYELNKDRDQLPEAFRLQTLKLIEGKEDVYEKISILYDYLQKNFRYVSIQLGIGGWQTMTAEDAVKYAYGDCKALTNLMKAMLNVAGIPSNYTLVRAGADEEDIETDLPSNQFNHVILQVPTESSPIWLECTSNINPAGFLGDFTKNRHVLVTTSEGGYLTKTPNYQDEIWNQIESKNILEIDGLGNATIQKETVYTGNYAESILGMDQVLDLRAKKDFFNKHSPIPGLIIENFNLDISKQDSLPMAKLEYDGQIQRYVQKTAKRFILRPFMGEIQEKNLANGIIFQKDQYEIVLPENLVLETRFENLELEDKGVSVKFDSKLEGKNFTVTREIRLKIPEELEEQEKADLFKLINNKGNHPVNFTRPNLTANHE